MFGAFGDVAAVCCRGTSLIGEPKPTRRGQIRVTVGPIAAGLGQDEIVRNATNEDAYSGKSGALDAPSAAAPRREE